jgi:hypothetical protein
MHNDIMPHFFHLEAEAWQVGVTKIGEEKLE